MEPDYTTLHPHLFASAIPAKKKRKKRQFVQLAIECAEDLSATPTSPWIVPKQSASEENINRA